MRKQISTLLLVLLCLAPVTTYGTECEDSCSDPVQLARMSPAILGSSGVATTFCSTTGSSDVLCEDFDTGSTTCGDDDDLNDNCAVAWTPSYEASDNIFNTSTGLEGTYGKLLNPSGDGSAINTKMSSPQVFTNLFIMIRIDLLATNASGSSRSVIAIRSSNDATLLCGLGINGITGKWVVYSNGAWNSDESIGPTQSTLYYVWIDYTKSDEAGCKITVSENSTKGTAFGAPGYSTGSTDAQILKFQAYSSNVDKMDIINFDKIRLGSSPFGNQ